jgi:hypothetical protein
MICVNKENCYCNIKIQQKFKIANLNIYYKDRFVDLCDNVLYSKQVVKKVDNILINKNFYQNLFYSNKATV